MEERVWHRHYAQGVPRELDFEEIPIHENLRRTARNHPQSNAWTFMNGRANYAEFAESVDRFAKALSGLGVVEGTRVAIQLPNLPQATIAFYAVLSLGGQVVLTNPLYTGREIEHQWKDAGCTVAVVADFIFDQKIRAIRGSLPIQHYVIASIPEYLRFPLNLLAPLKLKKANPPLWAKVPKEPGVHRFKKLLQASSPNPPRPEIDWNEIAVLQYTGGTTGVSKGAVLTHRNLSSNVQQIDAWFPEVEYGKEVILVCLPLFHVFGMSVGMNWAVRTGASMALVPNPRDIPTLVKTIVKHRVTLFPGVPALFNQLNNFPGIESMDVGSIKSCFSGSAPIPVDVMEKFEKLTGSMIVEGFGLSETSPVTHTSPLGGLRKPGSVGIPVSDTDAKVVDIDDGVTEKAIGEEGELILRGPQVMREYWNQPEETAKTLRDGWLYTGDLATMDEDGYFRIVGRKKDMISCGGFKVFPDEVDGVLASHDKILEAATIGIPDEKRGETVKSFIVLMPGESLTAEDVDAFCREQLAAYKVPRQVEFIEELPKSTVMKVLRRELRDRELAKGTD